MENLRISINIVDGSLLPCDYSSGRELIETWFGDDWGAPPTSLVIEATAEDGRSVVIRVPYDERPTAFVSISDEGL